MIFPYIRNQVHRRRILKNHDGYTGPETAVLTFSIVVGTINR